MSRWDELAEQDALFFIDPELSRGASLDEFVAAGRALVDETLAWVGGLPAHDRALEIGCGVGRNTVHLGAHFSRVDGIDVSPAMIRLGLERGVPGNVHLHLGSGRDLAAVPDSACDFVLSHLVFQHVESEPVLAGYLAEIARVLKPDGGLAALQFDTRPRSRAATLAHLLPDRLLPRRHRRGMRRHRRAPERVRELAAAAGLTVEAERGPGTAAHWLALRL